MNAIYVIKDNKVEVISDYKYDTVLRFNDDNYAMVKEGKETPYYLINEKGEKVNDKTYKSVHALSDGKWVVKLEDGSNQVLDTDGSIIVDSFKVK